MFSHRKFVAALIGVGLFSATGIALVEAQAANSASTPIVQVETPPSPAVAAPVPPPQPRSPAPAEPREDPAPVRARTASAGDADAELTCLARVILYEAGAESRAGQLAVGQVVMNRVRSPRFPNTICAVINQRGQFSAIRSFHPPRNARWNRALAIARQARDGARAPGIGNALFFHAAHVPAFRGRSRVARLGNHVFYR